MRRAVSLFAVLAFSLLLASPAAADEGLFGVWVNPNLAIALAPDGNFAWQDINNQAFAGTYSVDQSTLTLSANGEQMAFTAQLQGDVLQLTDPSGAALVFQRQNPDQPAASAQPAAAAQPAAGLSAQPGSKRYFLELLEAYPNMQPDQLVAAYTQLDADSILTIQIYKMVGSHMHLIMCGGSYANQIAYEGQNCQQLMVSYQQAVGFGANVLANYEQERQQLIISQKCHLGEIDAGSCSAYGAATGAYQQGSAQTGQAIVDNMKPACTERYDQNTYQYLGCW